MSSSENGSARTGVSTVSAVSDDCGGGGKLLSSKPTGELITSCPYSLIASCDNASFSSRSAHTVSRYSSSFPFWLGNPTNNPLIPSTSLKPFIVIPLVFGDQKMHEFFPSYLLSYVQYSIFSPYLLF